MEFDEQVGAAFLELQRLDLAVARDERELGSLPELVELGKKRKAHAKLKNEATRLYAQRKDVETELEELEEAELRVQEEVDAAQASMGSSSDYRHVQDVELQLTDLAKRLEKIEFQRSAATSRLAELRSQEAKLESYTKRFEEVMLQDAQAARQKAAGLKAGIEQNRADRAALVRSVPEAALAAYDQAAARHNGLGVEQLQGSVPSVCRTTLPSASLAELRRQGAVGTCPYCRRLIVIPAERV